MDYKTFRASDLTFREVSEAIREGREWLGCNENVARIRISRALKRGDLQEEANGTLSLSA